MRIDLIDADSILWTAAWLHRDNSDARMLDELDTFLTSMFIATRANKYVGFLKNPNEVEFRRTMFPKYKATRPPTPEWLSRRRPTILQHLLTQWKFVHTVNGFEVDDAIASANEALQYPYTDDIKHDNKYTPIVCSVDKDMKQIPGWNYNTKSKSNQLTYISVEEAERNMLTQILTGDSTDNIKGIPGIGPAKAKKILDEVVIGSSHDLRGTEKVLNAYENHHTNTAKALLDFAENVLQVVMRRDETYPFTLVDVPGHIRDKYEKVD